jgi:hypothetical protein
MTALDVVDQRLHGNARSDEHRRAAQDVRVGVNDGSLFHRRRLGSRGRYTQREAKLADLGEAVENNDIYFESDASLRPHR